MDSIRTVKPAEEVDLGHRPAVMLQRAAEEVVFARAVNLDQSKGARAIHRQEIEEAAASGPQVSVEGEQPALDDSRLRQDRLLDGLEIEARFLRGMDSQPLPAQPTVRNARRQNATRPR